MVFIGYHASHEQLSPSALLDAVVDAERAGFDGAFSSDHLAPWTPQQGHSGNTVAWLGAALARTRFTIGAVMTQGYRYHPVVLAHAIATFDEMFAGRFFAALGSGELLNEQATTPDWPPKPERTRRLGESVEIMDRLLRGHEVTHSGRVHAHRARLWTLPTTHPVLAATATTVETAAWAATWAQGLVTVGTSPTHTARVLRSYRDAGGRGDASLQVHFALESSESAALDVVRNQWLHGVVTPPQAWDVPQPEDFVRLAGNPSDEQLAEHVVIATDIGDLARQLTSLAEAGFQRLYLHDISTDQRRFVREVAPELLKTLREPQRGEAPT